MLTTAALLAATLTAPLPAADLAVDLDATSFTVLLPGATVDLSITNHGPDPLTSATVVVHFGANAAPARTEQCTFDGDTENLTCTFGALPAGATATISATVYFLISGPPQRFTNTATRTASSPADPDGTDDTDSVDCSFLGSSFPPSPVPTLYC